MQFNIADIVDYRLQCFELDYMSENENRLNFMIVSQLCALMHRDDKLMCSNRSFDGQKSPSKTMMDYRFRGFTVCMGAFLFLHGIGRKRLRLLRKRAIEHGIQPVRHGNAGRTPTHKVMTFEDVQHVVDFLNNYAENNALILPGRVASFRDQSLKLLPSWETKTAMHDLYAKSCPDDIKPVCRRSFVRIWKKTLPHIIIQMPRSDLCLTCQQNTTSMAALANMSDEVKTDRIKSSLEHLNLVQRERLYYTDTIQKCKDMLASHPTKSLLGNQVKSFSGASHISFDFAQQVHIPNLPDQPGPIYFLTPYKIGLFGIHNEAMGIQVNYVIPECTVTGKGANSVVSMVHHYLSHYTLGESVLYIHADNCVGQNKNNTVMQYLCWRVLCGLNRVIKITFLPVGHTKFAPDAGFGMIKSKFRRNQICTISEMCCCITESTPVTKMNQVQLVGDENCIDVPTYDWQQKFLPMNFRIIKNIKQLHHFTFTSVALGSVSCKVDTLAEEEVHTILTDIPDSTTVNALPPVIHPVGLSPERQWYLYENIRPLVPEYAQSTLCPRPACDRRTFAQAHSERKAAESSCTADEKRSKGKSVTEKVPKPESAQHLASPKRKKQTCSYCHETGHVNRVLRGHISCPRRRVAEEADG